MLKKVSIALFWNMNSGSNAHPSSTGFKFGV